jgi:hypothetical protein
MSIAKRTGKAKDAGHQHETSTMRGEDTMSKTIITVVTSCGREFVTPVNELFDSQLIGLLEQNADRTDIDPEQIAALRAELERRTNWRKSEQ